jgi:hypothetical protein
MVTLVRQVSHQLCCDWETFLCSQIIGARLEASSLKVESGGVSSNVLRGAAGRLEFFKFILILNNASTSGPISEAPVAGHSKREVQIGALHANPVSHSLLIQLVLFALNLSSRH